MRISEEDKLIAIRNADKILGFNYDKFAIVEYWKRSLQLSGRNIKLWRESRSNHIHRLGNVVDEILDRFFINLEEVFGRRSIAFYVLTRSSYCHEYDMDDIKSLLSGKNNMPPAFDVTIKAKSTDTYLKRKLSEFVKNGGSKSMNEFLSMAKKEINKKIEPSVILLTNGTTTKYQYFDVNMNDMLSCCLEVPEFMKEFDILYEYFGVMNSPNSVDFEYIELSEGDKYTNNAGEIINIPDKEGKIREIYRLLPAVQILSKAIHMKLDKIARRIEGNYTYKQREWINNLIEKRWNVSEYIICTDMSKYSDTLDRSFIIEILRSIGLPDDVCTKIDELYSLPVYHQINKSIYKGSSASYQGQYGDFPMITICNLVLQMFVYHVIGIEDKVGYKAAVGDDTGMIFPRYRSDMFSTIQQVYALVGVNINSDKTTELIYGNGFCDFVKLEFDSEGVRPNISPRSIVSESTDQYVREVFDCMGITNECREALLEPYGKEQVKRLMGLSIINGGISDHPINNDDVKIYRAKILAIRLQLERPTNHMEQLVGKIIDLYTENNLTPLNCPFIGFVSRHGLEKIFNGDIGAKESIIMYMTNTYKLGPISELRFTIDGCVGEIPSDLRREWAKGDWDTSKDMDKSNKWERISAYESKETHERLKKVKVKKDRPGVYDALMDQDVNNISDIAATTLDNPIYCKDIDEFRVKSELLQSHNVVLTLRYQTKTLGIFKWSGRGKKYLYVKFNGRTYGFGQSVNSKYEIMGESDWNKIRFSYGITIDLKSLKKALLNVLMGSMETKRELVDCLGSERSRQ